jgi:hypothetical protein
MKIDIQPQRLPRPFVVVVIVIVTTTDLVNAAVNLLSVI